MYSIIFIQMTPLRLAASPATILVTICYFRHSSILDEIELSVESVYILGFTSARILPSAVGMAIIKSKRVKAGRYS